MQPKFTPGPWLVGAEFFDNEGFPETVIHALDERAVVAVAIEFGPNNPGMRTANARLIAASPLMYDYLENSASGGDMEAIKIMEIIHAGS